jgi:hypothetical protein
MRSRSFLFEDKLTSHQPRNTHLVVIASIHWNAEKRSSRKLTSLARAADPVHRPSSPRAHIPLRPIRHQTLYPRHRL